MLRNFFEFDKYKNQFTKDYQDLLEDLLDYAQIEISKVKDYEEIKRLFALYHGHDYKTCYEYLKVILPYLCKWCISLASFIVLYVPLKHKFFSMYKALYPQIMKSRYYASHEKLVLLCQENYLYMIREEKDIANCRLNEIKKVKNIYEVSVDNFNQPFYNILKKRDIFNLLQYVFNIDNFSLYKKIGLLHGYYNFYELTENIELDLKQIGINITHITYTKELEQIRTLKKTDFKTPLLDNLTCILVNDLIVLNPNLLMNKDFKVNKVAKYLIDLTKEDKPLNFDIFDSELKNNLNTLKRAGEFDDFLKNADSNCECEGK